MKLQGSGVPVISADYMWLKGNHCRETELTWSKVVLRNGVDPYSVKVACGMVAFTGHRKVVLKSDGDSSITALKDAVKASCDVSMGVEVSPMGDSGKRRR